jgi:cell division protein ZapA
MEETMEMISITVLIAGRPYPLKIKAGDEASIRKVVKEINDQVNRFQIAYTTKDKQDCLAMVALTYAVNALKEDKETGSDTDTLSNQSEVLERLDQVDALLDLALHA